MQPTLCSKCQKNVAVIFITKIENGVSRNEGLCLKCAKEMGLKPVDDMMKQIGLSDEDLESITSEMSDMMENGGLMNMLATPDADPNEEDENDSRTATFPFLNKLFNNGGNQSMTPAEGEETASTREKQKNKKK